jgi:hypothetical protein
VIPQSSPVPNAETFAAGVLMNSISQANSTPFDPFPLIFIGSRLFAFVEQILKEKIAEKRKMEMFVGD